VHKFFPGKTFHYWTINGVPWTNFIFSLRNWKKYGKFFNYKCLSIWRLSRNHEKL